MTIADVETLVAKQKQIAALYDEMENVCPLCLGTSRSGIHVYKTEDFLNICECIVHSGKQFFYSYGAGIFNVPFDDVRFVFCSGSKVDSKTVQTALQKLEEMGAGRYEHK